MSERHVRIGRFADVRAYDPDKGVGEYAEGKRWWLPSVEASHESQSRGENGRGIKNRYPVDTNGEYSPLPRGRNQSHKTEHELGCLYWLIGCIFGRDKAARWTSGGGKNTSTPSFRKSYTDKELKDLFASNPDLQKMLDNYSADSSSCPRMSKEKKQSLKALLQDVFVISGGRRTRCARNKKCNRKSRRINKN